MAQLQAVINAHEQFEVVESFSFTPGLTIKQHTQAELNNIYADALDNFYHLTRENIPDPAPPTSRLFYMRLFFYQPRADYSPELGVFFHTYSQPLNQFDNTNERRKGRLLVDEFENMIYNYSDVLERDLQTPMYGNETEAFYQLGRILHGTYLQLIEGFFRTNLEQAIRRGQGNENVMRQIVQNTVEEIDRHLKELQKNYDIINTGLYTKCLSKIEYLNEFYPQDAEDIQIMILALEYLLRIMSYTYYLLDVSKTIIKKTLYLRLEFNHPDDIIIIPNIVIRGNQQDPLQNGEVLNMFSLPSILQKSYRNRLRPQNFNQVTPLLVLLLVKIILLMYDNFEEQQPRVRDNILNSIIQEIYTESQQQNMPIIPWGDTTMAFKANINNFFRLFFTNVAGRADRGNHIVIRFL
jgi:hypothetical protein